MVMKPVQNLPFSSELWYGTSRPDSIPWRPRMAPYRAVAGHHAGGAIIRTYKAEWRRRGRPEASCR